FMSRSIMITRSIHFYLTDQAATAFYSISLHDALPIWLRFRCRHAVDPCRPASARSPPAVRSVVRPGVDPGGGRCHSCGGQRRSGDRKSTRLNSSHVKISYAVFCLKKKKNMYTQSV